MLKRLYDWAISLAARKSAEWWLAFIAFVESSVFVIPAEVLFVPMGLARELATNPFLRADTPEMQARWGGHTPPETFAALRAAKDSFKG